MKTLIDITWIYSGTFHSVRTQVFSKTTIPYPLIRKRMRIKEVQNVSFLENFA